MISSFWVFQKKPLYALRHEAVNSISICNACCCHSSIIVTSLIVPFLAGERSDLSADPNSKDSVAFFSLKKVSFSLDEIRLLTHKAAKIQLA